MLISLQCWSGTDSQFNSQDVIQPRHLVEFAAENKLELVRAILLKHPDKVCAACTFMLSVVVLLIY